ncbi:hypothetical protein BGZ51_002038 [Haplosporangium sp. Z 767]|nr:hypothetical protein BGZ51_002038 [Haplosporangium sp. Z 767]
MAKESFSGTGTGTGIKPTIKTVTDPGTRNIDRQPSTTSRPSFPSFHKSSLDHSLPPIPPPPPPHDDPLPLNHFLSNNSNSDAKYNSNTSNSNSKDTWEKNEANEVHPLPPLPPPLPSKKTFYIDSNLKSSSKNLTPQVIKSFLARHPRISRHRRRFAALICTIVVLLLLLIVLLSLRFTREPSNSLEGGYGFNDNASATEADLRKHNKGKSRPSINRSEAPGWTRKGQGEGTYYDPSVKTGSGDFVMGACEFEYINSVYDLIAALNKPDFGDFSRPKNSPACGQCIRVSGPNGTVEVQVVDMCPGCKSGDVDLSPGAFAKVAHLDSGRVPISWERC